MALLYNIDEIKYFQVGKYIITTARHTVYLSQRDHSTLCIIAGGRRMLQALIIASANANVMRSGCFV